MTIIRGVIGANYGDEGKGTVVAHYAKHATGKVLNVLTNGGPQRAHNIETETGRYKFQHMGSATYYGADNLFSIHFILNPITFRIEYQEKYKMITDNNVKFWRDPECNWTTPWDMMANQIVQSKLNTGTCGMGIWETVLRSKTLYMPLSKFYSLMKFDQVAYINLIKQYYEKRLGEIPNDYYDAWHSPNTVDRFIEDCEFMVRTVIPNIYTFSYWDYDEIICENGQGLLLSDNGKDDGMTTPSNTTADIIRDLFGHDVKLHYVTRSYLTKHGGYTIDNECDKSIISKNINDDLANPYNQWQGDFRYSKLDLTDLKNRIITDAKDNEYTIEMTHVDEVDLTSESKKLFDNINFYDTALII